MSVLTHLTEWCDGILLIPDPFSEDTFPIVAAAVNLILKYTAEMEGGTGGVVGQPLAICRGTYSRWYGVLTNTRGVASRPLAGRQLFPG